MRSGNSVNGKGLLKQLQAARFYRDGDFQEGLYHVVLGLFKKVVIGDNMATFVNVIFRTPPGRLTGPDPGGGVRVRPADLRGLFGLQLHRAGCGEMDGHRSDGQFSAAVSRREPERLLAALAHQPVDVAARLRVHSAGGNREARCRRTAT